MRLLTTITALFLLLCAPAVGQRVSGHILDAKTKAPIPYATIQYAAYKGVVSNEEGYFNIPVVLDSNDMLNISSLGYESREFSVESFLDSVIYLKPQNITLTNVFLSNRNLSEKEIIKRVKENALKNHDIQQAQKRFFFRESDVNEVRQFKLKVEKSTLPGLDQGFMDQIAYNVPKVSDSYKEVIGDLYGNYKKQKLQVLKAANLHNPQSTAGIKEITKKMEDILQESLEGNYVLEIKSGIFGVRMDAEEIPREWEEEEKKGKRMWQC
jgi:hypothetical protein